VLTTKSKAAVRIAVSNRQPICNCTSYSYWKTSDFPSVLPSFSAQNMDKKAWKRPDTAEVLSRKRSSRQKQMQRLSRQRSSDATRFWCFLLGSCARSNGPKRRCPIIVSPPEKSPPDFYW